MVPKIGMYHQQQSFLYTIKSLKSSISINSILYQSFLWTQFKFQPVLYVPQIGPIPGQSEPGSDGNEVVPHITGASISDGLMPYSGHLLGGLRDDVTSMQRWK